MFARKVSVRLQPDSLPQFVSLMQTRILPWLRQQQGFLDLIILALPDASEVATLSFWDQASHAHAYNSTGYPEAVQLLEKLLDGIPYVKTFEVVSSTFPTNTRLPQAQTDNLTPDNRPAQHTCQSHETTV